MHSVSAVVSMSNPPSTRMLSLTAYIYRSLSAHAAYMASSVSHSACVTSNTYFERGRRRRAASVGPEILHKPTLRPGAAMFVRDENGSTYILSCLVYSPCSYTKDKHDDSRYVPSEDIERSRDLRPKVLLYICIKHRLRHCCGILVHTSFNCLPHLNERLSKNNNCRQDATVIQLTSSYNSLTDAS